MKTKQEIKKGCGEIESLGDSGCEEGHLCPTCQALLNQMNEILEEIDKRIIFLSRRLEKARENYKERTENGQRGFTLAKCYVVIDEKMLNELEELKQKLEGEKSGAKEK